MRRLMVYVLSLVLVRFFVVLAKFGKYMHVAELISLIPLTLGKQVRYEFYRRTLAACGEDVTVNFGTVLSYPDITLGSHVSLGRYNVVGHADLGDYTLTAQGCQIISSAHGHGFDNSDVPIRLQAGTSGRVSLGPDVWLGANTVVLANIGRGCVVGAGSVVIRDLPDWAVAVGNPARVLRYRTEQSNGES